MRKIALTLLIALATAGCAEMTVDEYKNAGQTLILEDYFLGQTRAWGIFEDRFGNVQREFVVDIEGTWDGKQLTLREDFVYKDGERETREWKLDKTGPDTWAGTTDNVVGIATGRTAGNAFNWRYDFNLKVEDSTWKVHFNDWMFLQPNGVLLNKATVSRWGIKIGTVFISFQKSNSAAATDAAEEAA